MFNIALPNERTAVGLRWQRYSQRRPKSTLLKQTKLCGRHPNPTRKLLSELRAVEKMVESSTFMTIVRMMNGKK